MKYNISLNGHTYEIEVELAEAMSMDTFRSAMPAPAVPAAAPAAHAAAPVAAAAAAPAQNVSGEAVTSPMPGTILKVNVAQGQAVKEGDLVAVLEAMKMENEIFAPRAGTVAQIVAAQGAQLDTGDTIVVLS